MFSMGYDKKPTSVTAEAGARSNVTCNRQPNWRYASQSMGNPEAVSAAYFSELRFSFEQQIPLSRPRDWKSR